MLIRASHVSHLTDLPSVLRPPWICAPRLNLALPTLETKNQNNCPRAKWGNSDLIFHVTQQHSLPSTAGARSLRRIPARTPPLLLKVAGACNSMSERGMALWMDETIQSGGPDSLLTRQRTQPQRPPRGFCRCCDQGVEDTPEHMVSHQA